MPGDAGFTERLLCVAQTLIETAVSAPTIIKAISEELLCARIEDARGTRLISQALGKSGVKIGRDKARVLMIEEGLKALNTKAFKPKTTDSKGTIAAPSLLAEVNIGECAVGKIIIGDITYIRLRGGKFAYLAVWQDKRTRRIIGWSLAMEMTAELVISALQKAILKGLVTRRSNRSFGSRKPIWVKCLSLNFTAKLFSAKYERKRQLL